MKKLLIYSVTLVLAIWVSSPVILQAQNDKKESKAKSENAVSPTATPAIPATPATPATPDRPDNKVQRPDKPGSEPVKPAIIDPNAPVPPGQDGKAIKDGDTKGYNNTAAKGNKTGWAKTEKSAAKAQKAALKAEKKKAKEMRRLEKENKKKIEKIRNKKSVEIGKAPTSK